MWNNKIGIDTNILVYTHREDKPREMLIARGHVLACPVVSAQVVSEYINGMRNRYRRLHRGVPHDENVKVGIIGQCMSNLRGCPIQAVTVETLLLAQKLIRRYKFQLMDSIIVASNLEAGCEVLYSEDMHHDLLVNGQLRILNPFRLD
jgi:predicted nucleic acid-binding protein